MTMPPPTETLALREQPAPNLLDLGGRRQGLWSTGADPRPDSRTHYVDGRPNGPFYWPTHIGWLEGVLEPSSTAERDTEPEGDLVRNRAIADEYGAVCFHRDGSVEVVLRQFDLAGHCIREARRDDRGRLDGVVREWDETGRLTCEKSYRAGHLHGPWGWWRGKTWTVFDTADGRVQFTVEQATRLGATLSKVGREWGDPRRFEKAVMKECGPYEFWGYALFALVRAGTLDPLLSEAVLTILPHWPGIEASDVDALLADPRRYPCTPGTTLLAGWPAAVDQLVARGLALVPVEEWVSRARSQPNPDRRVGLLFLAGRFGGVLTQDERDDVGLALIDAGECNEYNMFAVPGPLVDGLSSLQFCGAEKKRILAMFGL